MKKNISLLFPFLFSILFSNAQNKIALNHNGTSSFYNQLDSAIVYSQNGDTIYIPGGTFSLSQNITKKLFIIGVGHDPDSTMATNITLISGFISLKQGASEGALVGIYFTNGVGFSSVNDTLKNYLIERCNLNSLDLSPPSTNNIFRESIVRSYLMGSGSTNNLFSNNIIAISSGYVNGFYSGSVFKNNIFIGQIGINGGYGFSQTTFENNIFTGGTWYLGVNNCSFSNNIFVTSTIQCNSGCLYYYNFLNQSINSIFVNSTGTAFSYSEDYHLKSTCPGKNAGTDGTDIGIYGGAFPWKEGAVPFNPHVQFKNIANSTDANGNLNINIQVGAQDH